MRLAHKRSCGFTLVEICVSTALFVMVITLVLSGTMYSMKKSNVNDTQNELDLDAQITIESLRSNMRLSSLDEMYFYPEGEGPYTAISFPQASDDNGDGLFEKDEDGKIIWDKTVIYHIWPGSPNELRITTFSPRDITLSDTERQAQLDDVVALGEGSGTYNSEHVSSRALFENLLEWDITPRSAFDAYASVLSRDNAASVGYCLMGPGEHEVEFEVTGKNSASTGYKIGLDCLAASTSGGRREAEAQLPVAAEVGASAVAQYMEEGAWSGNYQLYFPATATGQSFTLSLDNDLWHETNFRGTGHNCEKTVVDFDESLSPKDFVVKLDGNSVAWEASMQTGDVSPGDSPLVLTNADWTVIRSLVRGNEMVYGGWVETGGGKCRVTFSAATSSITNSYMLMYFPRIGECDDSEVATSTVKSSNRAAITFGGASSKLIRQGESAVSDWVDLEIDKDQSYLVTYALYNGLSVTNLLDVEPRYWQELNEASEGTYYLEQSSPDACSISDWDAAGYAYQTTTGVLGVNQVEVMYESEGIYTSPVYDTQMDAPEFDTISWDADVPSGAALSLKVRTGADSDPALMTSWSNIVANVSTPATVVAGQERYIQFQATLQANGDCSDTPLLKDVTIDWPGEERMVDIGGIFTKGPDYGTFSVEVDGEPLRSAVVVNLEIYKDIYGFKGETKRVSSEAYVELRPRNSGK